MIKNIFKILAIVILAVIQLTLMPYLGLKNAWPNLVLLTALVLMLLDFDVESLLVASIGGIVLDLASPLTFGFYTTILVGLALITKFLLSRFLTEPNTLIVIVFLSLASVAHDLFVMVAARNFFVLPLFLNGFYSGLVGLLFYRFLEHWFKGRPMTKMVIKL